VSVHIMFARNATSSPDARRRNAFRPPLTSIGCTPFSQAAKRPADPASSVSPSKKKKRLSKKDRGRRVSFAAELTMVHHFEQVGRNRPRPSTSLALVSSCEFGRHFVPSIQRPQYSILRRTTTRTPPRLQGWPRSPRPLSCRALWGTPPWTWSAPPGPGPGSATPLET
jgi:hypothetical protein